MTEVLKRYRTVIIIISLLLFALLMWIFISKQNAMKIPTRGVFVINGTTFKNMEQVV